MKTSSFFYKKAKHLILDIFRSGSGGIRRKNAYNLIVLKIDSLSK
jgi:hypothetical protein